MYWGEMGDLLQLINFFFAGQMMHNHETELGTRFSANGVS